MKIPSQYQHWHRSSLILLPFLLRYSFSIALRQSIQNVTITTSILNESKGTGQNEQTPKKNRRKKNTPKPFQSKHRNAREGESEKTQDSMGFFCTSISPEHYSSYHNKQCRIILLTQFQRENEFGIFSLVIKCNLFSAWEWDAWLTRLMINFVNLLALSRTWRLFKIDVRLRSPTGTRHSFASFSYFIPIFSSHI